jgi:CrcB protein
MLKILIVGFGGLIGSASRYWISNLTYRLLGEGFPYGTLIVNITGCFFIGLLMQLFQERMLVNSDIRNFLTIGILGGFTTFSTFSFETIRLLNEGSFLMGTWNVVCSLIGCLAATWLGMILGRIL